VRGDLVLDEAKLRSRISAFLYNEAMWPKALIELVPHIVRLVPAANRFLQDKAGGDQASRQAVEALENSVHGDLSRITAAHTSMFRQLNDQSEKIDRLTSDLAASRLAIESSEGRMARLQRRSNALTKMMIASLVMMFFLLLMVFALLFKH
jgi:hypothetical protein